MRLFLILAVIIAILAIIFALQNAVPIAIILGIWRIEISLALVLVLTLGVGVVVGLLVSVPSLMRQKWKLAHQKRQNKDLEKELNEQTQQLANQQKRIDYLENSLKFNRDSAESTDQDFDK
ncbi:MAG: lipopolysaccharide assembly protein LapA domain-containing protein [Coleofasciculus sp. C1-SOL-03]|jgi:uncharacterized integral membrane protein|uniref:lipopolysaccharide assembly protein LapA domain-containing protein n=1 Tax=Coleofasciculus sp. C1-SOL-03 TaxID=3069522 RepID=UPI0032FDC998